MNNKLKFQIIFIIIAIIVGLTLGITGIYRFYIVQKIYNETDRNISKDNYYLKTTMIFNDTQVVTEAFYKNGKGKMLAENGIYTWVDGEDAYMIDEEDKQIYNLDINKNNTIGLVSYEMFASLIPGYNKNLLERFLFAIDLRNTIKSTKIDDTRCYMIKLVDDNVEKTIWIDKENLCPIKAKMKFSENEIYEYNYELKFLIVKAKDIGLPDITGYQVLDYETGEVIEESFSLEDETNTVNSNTVTNTTNNNIIGDIVKGN